MFLNEMYFQQDNAPATSAKNTMGTPQTVSDE
jgi:hypothetical protein